MRKLILPAAVSVCLAVSCSKTEIFPAASSKGVTVAFAMDEKESTKSHIQADGLSSEWENGDRLRVWAMNSAGEYILDACPFVVYGVSADKAIFTATLAEAMPTGRYSYFACSPEPKSLSGTTATFEIPSVQDGKVSSGADILVAEPTLADALLPVENLSDYTRLGLKMNHLLHHFRFFLAESDNPFGNEKIERMVLEFSEPVTGTITTDITSPISSTSFSGLSSSIELKLKEPLAASATDFSYACVSLRPGAFSSDATLVIKTYTASKYGISDPISLAGRSFEAGHSTPVRITASTVADLGTVRFSLPFNNIGEDINSVTLKAPSGCTWGNGSDSYVYAPGRKFTAGESFEIVFTEITDYRALSGKTVSVIFDTDHVTYTKDIVMPLMTSGSLAEISAGLPYLLEEDFSTVETFSSHDNYTGGLNSGDREPKSFLNGWSGGRVGASAGLCVRIACRRETTADYAARMDSAPIIELKKPADLELVFDYGTNNEYNYSAGDQGQTVQVGYVTTSAALSSGNKEGIFDSANSFQTNEKTGSWTSTPNNSVITLTNVPTGVVRISWRTTPFHREGFSNTTCWLYIDNVKVRIKSN
ncbi:MAG: fimbrillin family protein [Candidatus Cryptobacteroides sp.]|nr:fimbrillin family protein [Candidatus Cryptobacteroides sp.]